MRFRLLRKKGAKRRRIRKARLFVLLLALFGVCSVAFVFGLALAIVHEVPQLDPSARRAHDIDSVIYARHEGGRRVLAILRGDESRVIVEPDQISPLIRQAVVAVEDKRFYDHGGVDFYGVLRAAWADIRARSVTQGGSTITQQFVRSAYVRNERTIGRKVREAAFAWQLERRWSKERILTAYLNTIYFGHGAYGIQQAARTYFGVNAKDLDLAQSALLAGLNRDPSYYDPAEHPSAAKARRRFVLLKLVEQGKISRAAMRAADRQPLPKAEDIHLPGQVGPAQHFVNYVRDQLVAQYGADRVFGGGLEVTTTIDLEMQERAAAAVAKVLPDPDGPAAALVAMDPKTGAVKAMFGGTNFRRSQFNLATQAERQPGSSFKPIVLAAALEQGIAPSSEFSSKPVEIQAGGKVWRVTNYESAYLGEADLRTAMLHSDNAVYAQLTSVVRPANIVKMARRLGIRSELPAYFSIGLGAVAVNTLDMTRAYATLANDGRRVDGAIMGDRPRVIEDVRFRRTSRVVANAPVERQVIPPGKAELVTSILQDVVAKGTGKRARIAGQPVAGKTGTTDNYGDAWFVGYTPDLVVAIWVGYPNELRPMLTEFHGEPVAGSTLPAILWKEFMSSERTARGSLGGDFPTEPYLGAIPTRVVFRGGWKLDNGYCTNSRVLDFFAGEGPDTQAPCAPNEVPVPLVVGLSTSLADEILTNGNLAPTVVYVPAKAGRRPGVVSGQVPAGGSYVSAGEPVRLLVTKARYGLVPNVIGSHVDDARSTARLQRLRLRIRYAPGTAGTVVSQSPDAVVAAAPGMRLTIVVGRGRKPRPQAPVAVSAIPPPAGTGARAPSA
ncbi:MAG: PBP1A family penicillin-binding protein, partial [Actinobacteria bacterium]|nr:PBP1A family penicillin-binding protein [Actinomycetota bacterium]